MMAAAALRAGGGSHTHNSGWGLVSNKRVRKTRSPARKHVFHVMGQASRAAAAAGGRRVGAASFVSAIIKELCLPRVCLSVSSSLLSLPATVGSGLLSSSLRRGSAASGHRSVGQSPHSLCQWLAHTPVGRLCPLE